MGFDEYAKQNNLNESELKVLREIFNELEKGNRKVSVREISTLSYVSTASVIRLSKKLGFIGYSDMLSHFRNPEDSYVEFGLGSIPQSIHISEKSQRKAMELVDDIASDQYERVHMIGIGKSSLVAEYAQDRFEEYDIFITQKSPLDFINQEKHILLILISESGETQDLIFIGERYNKNSCKIYAITAQENSTLASLTNHKIILKSEKFQNGNMRQADFFTGNAINLMECIATMLYNRKYMDSYK